MMPRPENDRKYKAQQIFGTVADWVRLKFLGTKTATEIDSSTLLPVAYVPYFLSRLLQ